MPAVSRRDASWVSTNHRPACGPFHGSPGVPFRLHLGGIYARLAQVTASRSHKDDGILLEEAGPGDLRARLTRSELRENAGSGIHAEQADAGRGVLQLDDVTIAGTARFR